MTTPFWTASVTAAMARARAATRGSAGLRRRSPRQDDDVVGGDEDGDQITDGGRRPTGRRQLGAQRDASRKRELALPPSTHPHRTGQRREEPVGTAGVGGRAVNHFGADQ